MIAAAYALAGGYFPGATESYAAAARNESPGTEISNRKRQLRGNR